MKNKLMFDYIAIQIIFYLMMSVMCGYGAYLLMQIGYASSTIGILMALASILTFVLQPIAAEISDNSKKLNLFKISIIISILSLIASIFGYFQHNVSIMTSTAFIALSGIYSTLEPLNSSIPDKFKQCGYEIEFGVGRAFGSLSYALISVLMGFLTSKYNYTIILILDIIASTLMIIVYVITSKHYDSLPKKEITIKKEDTISYPQFFKRHVVFTLLSIALAGVYFGFTISDNLIAIVVDSLNGSSKDLGFIMGVKALLEVPVIFFYDKIEQKFSTKTLLKVATVSFTLKALLIYLAKTTTVVYISQLLQPFSLALMIPAMVSYTNKIMDKKEAVRGQALYIMAITLSSIASSVVGGSLAENYSVSSMLFVGFVVSAISSIAFIFILTKEK